MSQNKPDTAPKSWEINGQTFPFDLEDADIMERYENAFEAMAAEEAQITAESKKSAQIRAYCMLYRNLFDALFGDGTADKIFAGKPMNAAEHEAVYDSFLDFVRKQTAAAAERRAARIGKYLPKKK